MFGTNEFSCIFAVRTLVIYYLVWPNKCVKTYIKVIL